jgi:hypothetical protein
MSVWTEDDITVLKAAVRTGVLTVSYTGPPARTVTYQSLAAMRSLLAEMIADVGVAAGTRKPYKLASTKKGL